MSILPFRRPAREREWWIWLCPVCGHYETEAGDYFTMKNGTCPVWKLGGELAHPEIGFDVDPFSGEYRPLWTPRLVRVRVYER